MEPSVEFTRRAVHRRNILRMVAESEELAQQQAVIEFDTARARLQRLDELKAKVTELDNVVLNEMLTTGRSEEELDAETKGTEEIAEKMCKLRLIYARLLDTHAAETRSVSSGSNSKNVKLPKMEIPKFTGKLEDWLSWWGQFQSIHSCDQLSKVEKFQYLRQSLMEGSRAADVVKVYPCTEENYDRAVTALQERCGNKSAIIDLLMRELVQLVTATKKLPLTQLYDLLEGKLNSLDSLGRKTNNDCELLYPLIEASLSEEVLREWKRCQETLRSKMVAAGQDLNKLELLMDFLKQETRREEEISLTLASSSRANKPTKRRIVELVHDGDFPTAASLSSTLHATSDPKRRAKENCGFCEKPHNSSDCYTAPKLSLEERRKRLLKNRRCFLCLHRAHFAFSCRSKDRCGACDGRHHRLLCPVSRGIKPDIPASDAKKIVRTVTNCSSTIKGVDGIPLQTVRLHLRGEGGKERIVRAMLDPGAQKSAVLKKTAESLRLPFCNRVFLGHGLYGGGQREVKEHKIYRGVIGSVIGDYCVELDLLDEEKIVSSIPSVEKARLPEEMVKNIRLTDCESQDEIEVLLGNDVYGKLLTGNLMHSGSSITAIETKLGWVLSGQLATDPGQELMMTSMLGTLNVQQLWDLDLLGIQDPIQVKSKREVDEDTKFHFMQTLAINNEGRYEVALPWVLSRSNVVNNWSQAVRRLTTTTRKLDSLGRLNEYDDIFQEWIKEGFIEKVEGGEMEDMAHYLPHRAVIKESSATTKVRPVFDASCRVTGHKSLNECLAKGPNQLELIPAILLRFRLRKVAATSDIRKAFPMISIRPEDRDVLRFLWWEKDRETIAVMRHKRVVFGVVCSPFQLAAVLEFHLKKDPSPTAKQLLSSLYVDNCVISLESEEAYHKFKEEAVRILDRAKMDLRLWESNCDKQDDAGISSVLGLKWNRMLDLMCPSVSKLQSPEIITKRAILAISHALFDPLGMFCPISLELKMCLRETCLKNMTWDEKVPDEISQRVHRWIADLKLLEHVKIPRQLADVNPGTGHWSLHVFVDASKDCYAAGVFIRVVSDSGVTVRLAQAKSRLAPVKATIPRLELMACLIGARLGKCVLEALDLDLPVTYWSDSSTAITWIKKTDNWGVFVNNRVEEIRKTTNIANWRHLPGQVNPADLPSRGCDIKKLIKTEWWNGPDWLYLSEDLWPEECLSCNPEVIDAEKRKTIVASTSFTVGVNGVQNSSEHWFVRSNNYMRNVRILAYVLRWVKRLAHSGNLGTLEIEAAETELWRLMQQDTDWLQVKLPLVLNDVGLKCVKLRISEREDLPAFKLPVYLPNDHPVVEQMIMWIHLKNHHVGPRTLTVMMRERIWILNSKKIVHKVVAKCVICKRFAGKNYTCYEPPLPKERVNDARVFEVTGVDLGGPLHLTDGKKYYFAVFTCAVYRAVHLELLSDLSTEVFLQAFRRFIARRGRPRMMCSDQGTNFKGFDNLMADLNWDEIEENTAVHRIQWKFNPPSAPWWGGWWERIVGLVKRLMRRIYGKSKLDREEMETSLCDIEAVINSRPLTYVSEDSGELFPLTPAHFMSDALTFQVPDIDEMEDTMLRRRFSYRQRLRGDLRKRFRAEYMAHLISKVDFKCSQVQVGEIVLVGSDNRKRLDWPLARVMELIPGRDGAVRLVKLQLASGEAYRTIQRLYPLEVVSVQKIAEEQASQPLDLMEEENVELPPETMEESTVDEQVTEEIPEVSMKRTRSGRIVKEPERLVCQMLNLLTIE